jgi:hypothetical protein
VASSQRLDQPADHHEYPGRRVSEYDTADTAETATDAADAAGSMSHESAAVIDDMIDVETDDVIGVDELAGQTDDGFDDGDDADADQDIDLDDLVDADSADSADADVMVLDTFQIQIPATGDAKVDAALSRLGEVEGLPPAQHADVYEAVHAGLQDALADLDRA